MLRFDAPVQGLFRATTQPTTVGDVDLPAHATILASFAAANRDPGHFPDADRFDITRHPGDHLAFGHGIHYCLGASLARMEARILGETLQRRQLHLRPRSVPTRVDSIVLRGFTSYPVQVMV